MTTDAVSPGSARAIQPRNRKSIWRTAGIEIVGLLAYVVIIQVLARIVDIDPKGGAAIAVSLLLAGIPAVLWMALFYAQDRVEPEPLHRVALVAGAAGLLAVAVGQPLITKAFGVSGWLGRSTWTEIIGSILVIGFVQEFCKFFAIRATVYEGNDINQRVDGVVYGAAAGVGYATALNVSMVLGVGGFSDVRAGTIRIVITALTHGALGALVGYVVGRNRLEKQPVWMVPAVLSAAAFINGISYWLRHKVSERSISFGSTSGSQPARGLVLQAIIAAAVLGAVLVLVQRADHKVIDEADRDKSNRGPLLAAVGVTAIALLLGLVQRNAVLGETTSASNAGAKVAVPATWNVTTTPTLLEAQDLKGGFDTVLSMRSIKVDSQLTDVEAITLASNQINVERGSEKSGYKVFELDAGLKRKGHGAATSRYVFTADRSSFLQEALPVVVTGDDTYIRNGDTVHVLTLETPVANRPDAMPRYKRFVSSISFTNA